MLNPLTLVIQLALAAVLGGIIGFEREGLKRPAGFRTHILVCVGSTVAVHTNLQLIESFGGAGPMDPARLGAQVISGLGFLGAGTIIKEGSSVKGLTTAASLWVVGIIGLAIGAGQYFSAVLSTVMLYVILGAFQKIESRIRSKGSTSVLSLSIKNDDQALHLISLSLQTRYCQVKRIKKTYTSEKIMKVKLSISHPGDVTEMDLMTTLSSLPFVLSATTSLQKDKDTQDDYNLD